MFTKLILKLSETENMSYQMASLFHGVLMEIISPEYASELHLSQLHPYTQHLEKNENEWFWIITTLDERARHEIIDKIVSEVSDIYLSKKQINIKILEKTCVELSNREIAGKFYK